MDGSGSVTADLERQQASAEIPGPVRTEFLGAVAILTLTRPERLNAVSGPMYESLIRLIRRLRHDRNVRAIVITGTGRAFSAGADLKAHESRGESGNAPEYEWRKRYVRLGQAANRTIQQCPKPVVAAVNGHAIGGGLELALSCDFVIVADGAKLRFPEIGLGTFVGGGVTYTLPERVGALKAKELLLLGRFFTGKDAEVLGLANRALDAEAVLDHAVEIAEELATKAPGSVRYAKRLLNRQMREDMRQALALEADALVRCMGTEDWREGIEAFREKRTPHFTGE